MAKTEKHNHAGRFNQYLLLKNFKLPIRGSFCYPNPTYSFTSNLLRHVQLNAACCLFNRTADFHMCPGRLLRWYDLNSCRFCFIHFYPRAQSHLQVALLLLVFFFLQTLQLAGKGQHVHIFTELHNFDNIVTFYNSTKTHVLKF